MQVTYTINGQAYADTETLTAAGSPYTVTCIASKNGGESNSATMLITVETKEVLAGYWINNGDNGATVTIPERC